ncbi:MAG TPA: tetratricopeptide repeat protein [Alphaproteobacteria bacterium]|nr:tetratricopeptide repeat protein [Alphaproteobacteria bacterium]
MSRNETTDLRKLAEQAIALHRSGKAVQALPLYRRLLEAQPDSIPFRVLMAEALRIAGEDAEEARILEEAARLDPNAAGPQVLLGGRAERKGDRLTALAHFDKALAVEPGNAEARMRRAMTLVALGRLDDAETALALLVLERPEAAALWIAYGTVLGQRRKVGEAREAYGKALAIAPDLPEALHGLATIIEMEGDRDGALETYQKALKLAPKDPILKTNYATFLSRLGRMEEAEKLFEEALEIDPRQAAASNNLGSLLIKTGDVERGVALERKAAELDRDNRGYAANVLFVSHYDPAISPEALAQAHFDWGRRQAALAPASPVFANARDAARRPLKVGYVSADFRSHSVGHNFFPVLAAHDPAEVEVTLYSDVDQPDSMTEQLRRAAAHWRATLGAEDGKIADQIRADGIDILVDLAGHTGGNRLGVFARRAAPVQVTWLGYPDTTGLAAMDYRLVDAITDPDGVADKLASETLIRLPHGFIVALPQSDVPPVGVPPIFRNGYPTFGSFNNLAKVNRRVIALWARLLHAVPNSRLVLKSSFNSDEWVHHRFREAFAKSGIGPERLDFRIRTAKHAEHLALYGEVDVALDPFPYNGTMTTLEGLSMGVPLIALAGNSHVSRVSMSLLTRIGHPEWIAESEDAYIAKGVDLVADKGRLAALRMRLRQEYLASPLADAPGLARAIEAAYRDMWRKWCAT